MLPHFPITIMPGRCKEEEERRRASKKRGGRRKARIVAKKSGERREGRVNAIPPTPSYRSIENEEWLEYAAVNGQSSPIRSNESKEGRA
mmetsp:Transcript_40150/g.104073  ORF Transcript_40150/g.104073 Transcript_40150/m.104073 type:complete len:89 (-) Transcript_40150:134-400(-)